MELNHISLCTGIAGIDLAAEWAGFKTVLQVEKEQAPYEILCKHFPDVPKERDVRHVTKQSVQQRGITGVTILSGGFPCQPHSTAGKRKASSDERDLWVEFARIIREINPRWILAENVRGLLSSEDGRFFGNILRDLAEMGYHAGWGCWGAVHVGAYHRRERVFIVAYSPSVRFDSGNLQSEQSFKTPPKTKAEQSGWRIRYIRARSGRVWLAPESVFERVAYDVPHELDRLKMLGNAVNPYQIYPLLKEIAEFENGGE